MQSWVLAISSFLATSDQNGSWCSLHIEVMGAESHTGPWFPV